MASDADMAKRLTLPGLDDGALDAAEVTSDVADEVVLLGLVHDLLPERTGLLEVDYTTKSVRVFITTQTEGYARSVMNERSTLAWPSQDSCLTCS